MVLLKRKLTLTNRFVFYMLSFSNDAMKPSRLQNHLQSVHPEHKGKFEVFFSKRRDERVNHKFDEEIYTRY